MVNGAIGLHGLWPNMANAFGYELLSNNTSQKFYKLFRAFSGQ